MSVSSKIRICIGKGRKCSARTVYPATRLMLVVITGCALAGCMRNRLLQVERIMEYDVAAADSIINTMNVPASKRSNALYAMLKTQIDYKMYRDIQNDSLIRIATDFYGTKYKDYHAAMAWYSLGCVSGLNGQDSTAADAYLKAMLLFNDTLVRYYALSEQNLAHIYVEHDLFDEAMQMIHSCYTNSERLKDSAAIAFCEYNIANSLLNSKQYEEAQALFFELKDNKWLSDDSKDIPLIQLSKISQLKDSDYCKSLEYIDSFIIKNQHNVTYGTAFSVKADAYYGLNQIDSAQFYYELSLTDATESSTICDTYRRLSEIHTLKGNKDSATYYIKQTSMWMDSSMLAYSPNDIYKTILNNSGIISGPKSKLYRHYLPAIIFIAALIIAGLALQIIWYRKRRKKKHEFESIIAGFKKDELYRQ